MLTINDIIARIDTYVRANPTKITGSFLIRFNSCHVLLDATGARTVVRGIAPTVSCIVDISDPHMLELAKTPTPAKVGAFYVMGRIKVSNNQAGARLGEFLSAALRAGA